MEAIELRKRIIHFGCVSEELRVFVSRLDDCMDNSSHPLSTYCSLMACHLIFLDKVMGVHPVGIWETLCQDLDKLIMKAAVDQANTVCKNLQICADLESSTEGETHAMRKNRR